MAISALQNLKKRLLDLYRKHAASFPIVSKYILLEMMNDGQLEKNTVSVKLMSIASPCFNDDT